MAIVLTDDAGGAKLPQTGVVVATDGDEVGGVGAKGTVPHPALVVVEHGIAGQRAAFLDDLGDGAE